MNDIDQASQAKIIELKGIDKYFGNMHVLKKVNFTLHAGEVLGLVGGNGAGKSTLMNVLGGMVQPDTGKIFFEGAEVAIKRPADSQKLGIHFIHQELALFSTLTVAENTFISDLPSHKFSKFVRKKDLLKEADRVIKQLGVSLDPREKIQNLPMGQRQIVEILRAVSTQAKVIIFDEPTSSLSLTEKEKLFKVIHDLKTSGVAIIYITHFFEEVFDLCERICVLRDGQNVGSRKTKETSKAEIVELMLGESFGNFYPEKKSMTGEIVLECKNISHPPLLRNINLNIRAGEIVGLWGLLGSGRTELARVIYGIDACDGGEIRVNDSGHTGVAAGRRMGFVPENRREEGLFMNLGVKENITGASYHAMTDQTRFFVNSDKERKVCEELVEKLSIVIGGLNQKAATLSGGNQQKLIIARWLAVSPTVMIFDEPSRGLDIKAKADIHFLLNELSQSGKGILLISSEIEELIGMCNRIYTINHGEIVGEFTGADISKENLIKALS